MPLDACMFYFECAQCKTLLRPKPGDCCVFCSYECPICGPTIVVSRRHLHGDHVYCRSCGGEASVRREGGHLTIAPTGRRGTIRDLEPEIDGLLLDDLVRESSRHLAWSV